MGQVSRKSFPFNPSSGESFLKKEYRKDKGGKIDGLSRHGGGLNTLFPRGKHRSGAMSRKKEGGTDPPPRKKKGCREKRKTETRLPRAILSNVKRPAVFEKDWENKLPAEAERIPAMVQGLAARGETSFHPIGSIWFYCFV